MAISTATIALFAGAWSLVNITRTQNGNPIENANFGSHPAGAIFYTTSGFMSALLQSTDPADRPPVPYLALNASDAEWAAIGRHTLAYAGPFTINETFPDSGITHGQVIHGPILSTTLPVFVGSFQQRNFTFSEDGMYLNLIGDLGDGLKDDLWWTRLEKNVTWS